MNICTQGDLNLNICEAHAFNTLDKFSLDVFVVNGWKGEVCLLLRWQMYCDAHGLLRTALQHLHRGLHCLSNTLGFHAPSSLVRVHFGL